MRLASFSLCASVAAMLLHSADALAIDVTINLGDVAVGQIPDPYLGWNAYLDTSVASRRSTWGDPQKSATNGRTSDWVGNPDVATLTAPDNRVIRTVAHGSTTAVGVLEDIYRLAGASKATLMGTFRVKYTNNTAGTGTPLLSLQLGEIGGPGISVNVGDKDYPIIPDHYWYQLVQYKENHSATRLLYAIQPINPSAPTGQGGPTYHTATLFLQVMDATTNVVRLWWDGNLLFNQQVDGFSDHGGDVEFGLTGGSYAAWGSDTAVQVVAGLGGSGSEQQIYWHSIRLTDAEPCNRPFADINGDGDVDMDDFSILQQCYGGSANNVFSGASCVCLDRDFNGVIGEPDFVQFTNCATRANVPWSQELTPNCQP